MELEYSLDLGLTWEPVVRDCLPTSPDCSSYTLQRLLVSDTYNKWGRVTLPVPLYARSALPCGTICVSLCNYKNSQIFRFFLSVNVFYLDLQLHGSAGSSRLPLTSSRPGPWTTCTSAMAALICALDTAAASRAPVCEYGCPFHTVPNISLYQ